MTDTKRKKRAGTAWMAAGLLLIAASLILTLYNILDAGRAEREALEVVGQLEELILDNVRQRNEAVDQTRGEGSFKEGTLSGGALLQEREMPTVEIDGSLYIGVLEIPSLSLSLPVMAQWSEEGLKISPGRYSGSYYQDNLVIAGHNYARHFSPIKWIEAGSEILFTDVEGNVYRYTVEWLETIAPENVEEMVTGDWDLTLFTCTTSGAARCAVRCVRAE